MTTTTDSPADLDFLDLLDLDAAKREGKFAGGIPIRLGGTEWRLPGELPAEALDPIFSLNIDMASLLAEAVRVSMSRQGDAQEKGVNIVLDVLTASPNLPREIRDATRQALATLFDASTTEAKWADFVAARPSLPDYARVIRGLSRAYGVTLGEAFGSRGSSADGGETSSGTSPSSTDSTPEPSGDDPETPASSDSAG